MTDFWEFRMPALASIDRREGSESPMLPKPPIFRKLRREIRLHKVWLPEAGSRMRSMGVGGLVERYTRHHGFAILENRVSVR
jgi:hypothetical protein